MGGRHKLLGERLLVRAERVFFAVDVVSFRFNRDVLVRADLELLDSVVLDPGPHLVLLQLGRLLQRLGFFAERFELVERFLQRLGFFVERFELLAAERFRERYCFLVERFELRVVW